MTKKLLVVILLAAIIVVYAMIFAGEPKGKPRKLTPAEQQDSVTPGRRSGRGE